MQMTLAMMNDELGQARTSKKEFLDKIESIIPWDKFIGIIEPCYYKGERGNKPYPLELMLRIFLLQNLYDLADMRVMTEKKYSQNPFRSLQQISVLTRSRSLR